MAVKKVIGVSDPRLREVSRAVTRPDKKIKNLVQNLKDTLKAQKDPEGVGLAAPQIGVDLRVFVMRNKNKTVPIINPEIIKTSKKTNDPPSREASARQAHDNEEKEHIMEGCLSLPHYYGPVKRAYWIELKYRTTDGQEKVQKFTGFPAQIVQHEIDHLNGKIFIDRLFSQKRQLYKLHKGHWHEVDLP